MCFFFFKQKTAYEMRISDWSSDVCSSDLPLGTGDVPFEWAPDVWLLMVAIGAGYLWALRHLGPRVAPDAGDQRRQVVLFAAGLAVLTISASWPIAAIGDGYLFSVRSEERRVGKESVSTCRSRWWPYPYK